MKPLHLLFSLLLCATACQEPDRYTDNDPLLLEGYKLIGLDNTVRRSLSDVWINTATVCGAATGTDTACAKQLDGLQRELNALNPIPVPQPGAALPTTAANATLLYRRFMAAHRGEPILAVFQQLYPRILLNKYGVINGTDYGLIAYYLQQLTLSNGLDFETRTHALTVLTGHLPADLYARLLTQTSRAAEQEQVRRRRAAAYLRGQLATMPGPFIPGDPETYRSGLCKKILARYGTSMLTNNLAQLRRLQATAHPPVS